MSKLTYVFQFFRFSLSPPAYKVKNIDLLSQSFLKNQRLYSLIKDKFLDNEDFLASFTAELISKNQTHLLKSQYANLYSYVLRKFPENIFLDHLGLDKENGALRDWENFDALALKLFRESRFDFFVIPFFAQRFSDEELFEHGMSALVYYLNWMENFSLAGDLLDLSYEEKKIGKDEYEALKEDLISRKRKQSPKKELIQELALDSPFVSLDYNGLKIILERNLLRDGSFEKKNSLKQFWTFSDMSDREPFSKGSFYGGRDHFENKCMRVMGFFVNNLDGKSPVRGGFWYSERIFLEEKTYCFCFSYKTLHESENPSFWLSYGLKEPRTGPASLTWKKVYFIFNNSHYKLEFVKPLLRMWGTGSVWFDNIGLYEIEVEGTAVEKDALFIQ